MEIIETGVHPIKAWTDGVLFEKQARLQLERLARMPFIFSHVAVMPDVHPGRGSTVGSVIATRGAIIPAAVSVDIGCGMSAVRTSIKASDLPTNLKMIRESFERAVPVGMEYHKNIPNSVESAWNKLAPEFFDILKKHPKIAQKTAEAQLASAGSGNHFIELTIDKEQHVWLITHSGSRGVGNRIGEYFIERAKKDMKKQGVGLEDSDLAYITENTQEFDDYIQAVRWAQIYAKENRRLMGQRCLDVLRERRFHLPKFKIIDQVIDIHHNYVEKENHFDEEVWVTRKGAVRAEQGDLAIIPGSMGARSFIVRGKGNPESFKSCSHGAGRAMSRKQARESISMKDFKKSMEGVEARINIDVIDEAPASYKNIDDVMAAQQDLVEIVHEMKQILVLKG